MGTTPYPTCTAPLGDEEQPEKTIEGGTVKCFMCCLTSAPSTLNGDDRDGPIPLAFPSDACGKIAAACDGVVTSSGGKKVVQEGHAGPPSP